MSIKIEWNRNLGAPFQNKHWQARPAPHHKELALKRMAEYKEHCSEHRRTEIIEMERQINELGAFIGDLNWPDRILLTDLGMFFMLYPVDF